MLIPTRRVSEASAGGRLTIDLAALKANYRRFARLAAPAECAPVVKACAYGIGVEHAVPALLEAGARSFFVVQLDEAPAVRALAGAEMPIHVLNGLYPGTEQAYLDMDATPVLNTIGQARRWQAFARQVGRPLAAALQLDSGMSRLGLPMADVAALADDPGFRAAVDLRLVMSHLACAEHAGDPANARQLAAFETAAACFPGVPRSLANSGGTVLGDAWRGDMVRVGIALYGGNPTDDPAFALAPVVALDAKVIQLRDVPAGTGIGYGLTFTTTRPSRIATLGVGYADGWLRSLGNRGAAYRDGVRLPIVGRVSMDSMTIDVTDLAPVPLAEGDWVELIGPHQGIDGVARDAGTIAYEVLTSLGSRYHIRVVDGTGG